MTISYDYAARAVELQKDIDELVWFQQNLLKKIGTLKLHTNNLDLPIPRTEMSKAVYDSVAFFIDIMILTKRNEMKAFGIEPRNDVKLGFVQSEGR